MFAKLNENLGHLSNESWFRDLEVEIPEQAPLLEGLDSSGRRALIELVVRRHLEILEKKNGRILKDAPETAVTVVNLEGQPSFCVKQFNDRGLLHRIKGLFRKPQGLRTFYNGSQLISHGIPAAYPIALIRNRVRGIVSMEWVIMECMEDFIELDRYLVRKFEGGWSKEEQKSAVRQFGRFIGSMHSKGIFHSDLKTCNIMVLEEFHSYTDHPPHESGSGEDSFSLRFCLVDYDEVYFAHHISMRKRVKNLVQIFLSTPSLLNRVERMRFLDEYALHAGLSSGDRKRLAQDVIKKSHGKNILYVGFEGDVVETLDLRH
jgi:hypothetical protein